MVQKVETASVPNLQVYGLTVEIIVGIGILWRSLKEGE